MNHKEYLAIDKMSKSLLARFAENPSTYLEPFLGNDGTRLGTAVDTMFYTPDIFKKTYLVLDWEQRPKPQYKMGALNEEWLANMRDEAEKSDLVTITPEDMQTVQQICDNLKSDETIREMLELSRVHEVYWGEMNGVKMKCEIDNAYELGSNRILCDLKTIHSMDKFIGRARYELNYRMMPFVYSELMRQSSFEPDQVEFLVVDTSTFDFQRFICTDEYLEASKDLVFMYLDFYKQAKETNNFSHRIFGDQYIYPIGG